MKKPIIHEFSFIKAICALGIIVAHFSSHLSSRAFLPLYEYPNGSWGSTIVTVFFIVSGALLYYHYADQLKLGTYFYKRWKGIFPAYYLAYAYFEIQRMIAHEDIFYRGNPIRYLFTLFGMDGYLYSTVPTYYILGEWFTGAILCLYLLFPVVLWAFQKNSAITFSAVLVLYAAFLNTPIIVPEPFRSIASCLISFVTGMVFVKNKDKLCNKWCVGICAIGFLLLNFVKLPISANVSNHLLGLCLFGLLYAAGHFLMKISVLDRVFEEMSRLSYAVFLLHHRAIFTVLDAWDPVAPSKIIILIICTTIMIFCEAKVLSLVTNAVTAKIELIFHQFKQRREAKRAMCQVSGND